jgi:hypothetical protein
VTIGFLVLRKGYLKVMGALIQAALDRRHDVVLLWDPKEAKPGEEVAKTDLAPWPTARVVEWSRGTPLAPTLGAAGVHALVGPSLYSAFQAFRLDAEVEAIRGSGVRLYSVDYGLDTITSDPAGYGVADVTFYASEWQRQLHWRVKAAGFARIGDARALAARSAVVGSTMLDQLGVVDRAAVRKRYGLDGRPVVLFMTLKMQVPDPWRRLVWGESPRAWRAARALTSGHAALVPEIVRTRGYRDLVEAVRRLCERSGAVLVVKSRRKNGDPAFLEKLAVFDEDTYPYTSMGLMAVADLCVHFQSAGVLEAALAGVPSLSVRVSQEHLRGYPTYTEFYGAAPDTFQNFPGVVWSVSPRDAIARLDAAASLEDFRVDPERRRAYVAQFVGFDDTRSSERALDVIEARRDVAAQLPDARRAPG